MAPRLRVSSRLPRGFLPWAAASLLLTLGVVTTVVDVLDRPAAETLEANSNGQRVIVDPITGAVSGIQRAEADDFEVGTTEEVAAVAAKAPEPAAAPETTAPEAAPADGTTPPAGTVAPVPATAPALRTEAEVTALPTVEPSGDSIVKPPAPEVTELVKNAAPLPKRGDKGAAPSNLYAKRFTRDKKTAYLSIVITDAGFNNASMAQLLKLPRAVTVSLSPYAMDIEPQIALLHTAGFETWAMLPVMGTRYPQDDPGPMGLIAGTSPNEQLDRLHQTMAATLGAVGFVLPMDESLSSQPDFSAILKEIDARGLLVLSTAPGRAVDQLTTDKKIQENILRADLVLDSTASAAFIQSKLAGLKALLKKQGNLIVVASARPQTLALLADWLKNNPLGNGMALAPLSGMRIVAPPPAAEKKPAEGEGHEEDKESGDAEAKH